jgi:cytochrome c5
MSFIPSSNGSRILHLLLAVASVAMVACGKAPESSQTTDQAEQAVAARIQKVGQFRLGAASHEVRTGEAVFKAQCSTCHATGLLGSPKFGDAAAWAPRISTGFDALLTSALKGKNAMTAQGGGAYSDFEIARAVVYMTSAAGGKFEEPKAPEAAASAAK